MIHFEVQESDSVEISVDSAVLVSGEDGKSAYQIALDNGFVGTEEEWLESLHGTDGKDGKDGRDGKDGYVPVKGVDYFTEEETEELTAQTIDTLAASRQIGSVTEEKLLPTATGERSIPYSEGLIGLEVVDYKEGRRLAAPELKRPNFDVGEGEVLCGVNSAFQIMYGRMEVFDKDVFTIMLPHGVEGAFAKAAIAPGLLSADNWDVVGLIYAFEPTEDIEGMGVRMEKGWNALNGITYEVKQIDIEKMSFWFREADLGVQYTSDEARSYIHECFPLRETIRYEVTERNLVNVTKQEIAITFNESLVDAIKNPYTIEEGVTAEEVLVMTLNTNYRTAHSFRQDEDVTLTVEDGNEVYRLFTTSIDSKYLPEALQFEDTRKFYTFDGNAEGLVTVTNDNGTFVKISEETPDLHEAISVTLHGELGGESIENTFDVSSDTSKCVVIDVNENNDLLMGAKGTILVAEATDLPLAAVISDIGNSPIPATGLYVAYAKDETGGIWVTKVDLGGELKTIDPKYLPSIPHFDLAAMGMGTVEIGGNTQVLSGDQIAPIAEAMSGGIVKVTFKVNFVSEINCSAVFTCFSSPEAYLWQGSAIVNAAGTVLIVYLQTNGSRLELMTSPLGEVPAIPNAEEASF